MSKECIDDDFLDASLSGEANKRLFDKASLISRVKCTIIDSLTIILLMYLTSILLNGFDIKSGSIRGSFLGLIFLYEPFMTSVSRTLGQKIMSLRVSTFDKQKINGSLGRIKFLPSIIRYFFKIMLGWLSLLTIHSNPYGRAIHDKVSNSIMINY